MRLEELGSRTTDQVEFYSRGGRYIGFRQGVDWYAFLLGNGPDYNTDDLEAAEVVSTVTNREGNDAIVLNLA